MARQAARRASPRVDGLRRHAGGLQRRSRRPSCCPSPVSCSCSSSANARTSPVESSAAGALPIFVSGCLPPRRFFAGLHGLEIEGPDLRFAHHAVSLAAPAISILSKELRRATKSLAGVFIEDKTLSVVLHTRGASKADQLHATTRFNALAEPFLRRRHASRSPWRPHSRAAAEYRLGER